MTTPSGAQALSTLELYAGLSQLDDTTIRLDIIRWLRIVAPRALRDPAGLRAESPGLITEAYLTLAQLARHDVSSMTTGLAILSDQLKNAFELPAWRWNTYLGEVSARVLIYRLDLGDADALADTRSQAAIMAQTYGAAPEVALLAFGLMMMDGEESCWNSPGTIRRFAIQTARHELGIERRLPEPVEVEDDLDLGDLMLEVAQDQAGLHLYEPPRPPPTRMVLAKVGAGKEYSSAQRATTSSLYRGEFNPIAGVPLPLVQCDDLDDVGAALRARWPWAADAIDTALAPLPGRPWVKIRNILLLSAPGTGKTAIARAIGEAMRLHALVYACAGVSDSAFGGTSRQWSTARASVPAQAILAARQANPLIVLDEIEKVGTSAHNGRLVDALVPMLEPESSSRYFDPGLEMITDLSCVSYVATANSLDGVPGPLRDRFLVVRVPEPGPEHLGDIARRIVEEIRQERGLDERWVPDLAGDEEAVLREHWRGGSLRVLRRMVETLVSGRETLAARH
jgi:hypothetical protein